MSTLYVVATPIGNLEDVTIRSLRVLREVGLVAAEDTRVTRRLMARHGITTKLTSYHRHNKRSKLPKLLELLTTMDIALVSDAGTPGINDPGSELVSAAAMAGVGVVSIPGPSAVTSSLAVSGFPADHFRYLGFLPRKRSDRKMLLDSISKEQSSIVIFEAPHRLKACLEDVRNFLGDRRIVVCRELTKIYEDVFRGTVSEAITYFHAPRGEFTIVVEGGLITVPVPYDEEQKDYQQNIQHFVRLRDDGVRAKEAVSRMMERTGMSKKRAYAMWLDSKKGRSS